MSKIQRLELTWVGKNENNEIEPRILIEDANLGYCCGNSSKTIINGKEFDNMLIHGDNLLALKALEQEYSGMIKCIYIDPPYNTGAAFEHYDDNLQHSIWLNLMRQRIEILHKLLSKDGAIFVQIDDNEQAYLTILMDEIFGRENRINTICVNMSNMSGVKVTAAYNGKRFPKVKEYILVYVKNLEHYKFNIPKRKKETWDSEYNYIIEQMTKQDYDDIFNNNYENVDCKLSNWTLKSLRDYADENNLDYNSHDWKYENAYRIISTKPNAALLKKCNEMKFEGEISRVLTAQGLNKFITTNYNKTTKTARIEIVFALDTLETFYGDHWDDIVTTGGIGQEGNVEFKNSKKPEKLLKRIIETVTNEGDIVLDSFLGSGTTCAVAHKLNRHWIGIEMGEHAYTLSKKRLDAVISGEDQSGISRVVGWQGGGSYKFYELAPTLIKEDDFGQIIINPEYNAQMLASAVAKHEGYFYNPNKSVFWKQANNKGKSYLYVTTNHVNSGLIETIKCDMQDDECLLIICKSFDSNCNIYNNISIKKIPQAILNNCEFGVDNYNLNIINPPEWQEEGDDE